MRPVPCENGHNCPLPRAAMTVIPPLPHSPKFKVDRRRQKYRMRVVKFIRRVSPALGFDDAHENFYRK